MDVTKIVALRARAKAGFIEREGVNLTFLPFFAKAVVEALKSHPNINASYDEAAKQITYYDAEHLGIAVDTDQGLLSPSSTTPAISALPAWPAPSPTSRSVHARVA
ncbi:hypothetical protein GCM10020255_089110 [Rhodococcus baikonurensis]